MGWMKQGGGELCKLASWKLPRGCVLGNGSFITHNFIGFMTGKMDGADTLWLFFFNISHGIRAWTIIFISGI
jgi:hypothetical protein